VIEGQIKSLIHEEKFDLSKQAHAPFD